VNVPTVNVPVGSAPAGNAPATSLAIGTGPVVNVPAGGGPVVSGPTLPGPTATGPIVTGPGPTSTGPAGTGPAGTGATGTGTAGTSGPAGPAPTAPTDAISLALDAVQQISLAAELSAAIPIQPVVHLSGNDVTLVALDPKLTAGVGIAVIFSPREESGTVLMTANRVLAPDTRTVAGAVFYPAAAAVTGNIFAQVQVVGNVIGAVSHVQPIWWSVM
jgi:hypothetical protein